ncbi:MAG: secretin N-terminal domain-containing protein [Limisphaerales bacterium]
MKTIVFLLLLAATEWRSQAQAPPAPSANPAASTNRVAAPRRNPTATPATPAAPNAVPPGPGTAAPVRPALPALPGVSAPGTQPPAGPNLPPSFPPAFPTPAASAAVPPPALSTNAPGKPGEDYISVVDFKEMTVEQFLDFYATTAKRTVLRSAGIVSMLKATVSFRLQTPLTRTEAIVAMDTLLELNNITMIPIGDKLVSAVPNATVTQEGAAFSAIDADKIPEGAQFVTRIVQLKYAVPNDVAPALQQFAKVPNGIVPIDTSKVIVLRDYAANVKRMTEVIDKIDHITETDYTFEVIPIRFSKVEDIYYSINSLISGGGGPPPARPATAGGTARPGQFGGAGMGGMGGAGMGGMGGMGGGGMGAMGGVGGMGAAGGMGQPGYTGGSQGNRNTFQQRLASIVNKAAAGPGQVQLLADAKIVPDDRSNSMVVFANKRDLQMLTNIIAKLDVALAQVLIEGIVIEVSLDKSSSVGVSFLQQPKQAGKFVGAGGANNGQSFLDPRNFIAGSNSAPASLSSLPSGFNYFGTWGNDLDVALNAIAQDSTINVISRPRIQTSHAVPAEFFVGDSVPYVTTDLSGGYGGGYGGIGGIGGIGGYGGYIPSVVQYLNVGVDLSVTPFITPDGLVTMDINENISQLGTPVTINGNPQPTTSTRLATATVSVRDRGTIILGGFISNNKSKSNSGVPVLKDIPLLGALFRSNSKETRRTELIILMRPTVLATPDDAAAVASAEKGRLFGVQRAEKEMQRDEQESEKAAKSKKKKRFGN